MKKLLTIFSIIIFMSSCSSLDVIYDMDQSVDFNQFKTFSFYPWDYKHGYQINDYDKQTIMMAIQDGLESKGYTYKKEGGDMIVSLFVTLEGIGSDQIETNLDKRDQNLPKKISQVMMKFPDSTKKK